MNDLETPQLSYKSYRRSYALFQKPPWALATRQAVDFPLTQMSFQAVQPSFYLEDLLHPLIMCNCFHVTEFFSTFSMMWFIKFYVKNDLVMLRNSKRHAWCIQETLPWVTGGNYLTILEWFLPFQGHNSQPFLWPNFRILEIKKMNFY